MVKRIIFFCLLVAAVYGYGDEPVEGETSAEKPGEHKKDSITFLDTDQQSAENKTDDVDPLQRSGFVDSLIATADQHKDDIIRVIDSGVKFTKNRIQGSIRATTKILEQLNEQAVSVIDGVTINVHKAINKVINTIDELSSKLPGADIAECIEMAREVNYTASRIVSRVSTCVTEQVDEGKYRVENVAKVTDKFLADMDKIRDRAVHCAHEGNGTIDAIGCLKDALKETYDFTQKRSPVLIKSAQRATKFILLAIPSLAGCTTLNTVSKFFGNVDDTVSDIRVCIKEKMDAIKKTT